MTIQRAIGRCFTIMLRNSSLCQQSSNISDMPRPTFIIASTFRRVETWFTDPIHLLQSTLYNNWHGFIIIIQTLLAKHESLRKAWVPDNWYSISDNHRQLHKCKIQRRKDESERPDTLLRLLNRRNQLKPFHENIRTNQNVPNVRNNLRRNKYSESTDPLLESMIWETCQRRGRKSSEHETFS
jgi:hypothetical protein